MRHTQGISFPEARAQVMSFSPQVPVGNVTYAMAASRTTSSPSSNVNAIPPTHRSIATQTGSKNSGQQWPPSYSLDKPLVLEACDYLSTRDTTAQPSVTLPPNSADKKVKPSTQASTGTGRIHPTSSHTDSRDRSPSSGRRGGHLPSNSRPRYPERRIPRPLPNPDLDKRAKISTHRPSDTIHNEHSRERDITPPIHESISDDDDFEPPLQPAQVFPRASRNREKKKATSK